MTEQTGTAGPPLAELPADTWPPELAEIIDRLDAMDETAVLEIEQWFERDAA